MLQPSSVTHRLLLCAVTVACILLAACAANSANAGAATGKQTQKTTATNEVQADTSNKDRSTIMMTTVIYEGNLAYPVPHWVSEMKDLNNIKVFRDQTKNTFTFEQIPREQDFESWTMLYGVYGWHLPDYDFKRFIAESLNALALGCKEQAKSRLVSAEGGNVIMTYHCAALVDPLVQNGKDTESGFLYMSHVGSSYVKVYQAWRASNKDRDTPAWPINDESVANAVERMKQITYTPRQ